MQVITREFWQLVNLPVWLKVLEQNICLLNRTFLSHVTWLILSSHLITPTKDSAVANESMLVMRTQETNLLPRLLFWVSPPYHSCWTIPNPNGTPIMVVSAVQVQKNTSKWKISSWLGYIYLSFTRQVWRTYSLKLKLLIGSETYKGLMDQGT